jgi:hypothetical protein
MDLRLAMIDWYFFFLNWLVGTGKEVHWEMESKRPDQIKTVSTGKTHRAG